MRRPRTPRSRWRTSCGCWRSPWVTRRRRVWRSPVTPQRCRRSSPSSTSRILTSTSSRPRAGPPSGQLSHANLGRPYGVTVQLLLVRHALPLRSEPGQGSDPHLSEVGVEQANRLPAALARFPVSRLVSSPQLRAVQTAEPVATALGLPVDVDDRLAEYDRDMSHYVPIEEIAKENPEELARLANGHLPSSVDEEAFCARIAAALADLVTAGEHDETVAVF